MIRINLLSPFDIENNKWERINNLITSGAINIITIQIIFVALFGVSIQYLNIENDNIKSRVERIESNQEIKEIRGKERDIKQYRDKLEYITMTQKNHLYWVPVLEKFSETVPEGVLIGSFNVEKNIIESTQKSGARGEKTGQTLDDNKFKIKINGYASTRENLLNFENNLKNSTVFVDLIFNRSNYVDPVDIDFNYTFFIEKKNLLFTR